MRAMILLALPMLATPLQAADWQKRIVNLDRPGAMEAVEAENPRHFRLIEEIIDVSQAESCETLPQLFKARAEVKRVDCSSQLLLMSLPPKRHLTFTLDEVVYTTNAVQYRLTEARRMPVPR